MTYLPFAFHRIFVLLT